MNGIFNDIMRMCGAGFIVGLCAVGTTMCETGCSSARKGVATVSHDSAAALRERVDTIGTTATTKEDLSASGSSLDFSAASGRECEKTSESGRVDIERDDRGAVAAIVWNVAGSAGRIFSTSKIRGSDETIIRLGETQSRTHMAQAQVEKTESCKDSEQEELLTESEAGGSGFIGKGIGWGVIGLFLIFLYRILSPYIDRLWRR